MKLPRNFLGLVQIVEYLRAFLMARLALSRMQVLTVISGAFGLFKRQLALEVGGYSHGTVGEDMELGVKLHRHLRDNKKPYRIEFIPEPVCWTEAPDDLTILGRQRARWQRGALETFFKHKAMLFNPRYGLINHGLAQIGIEGPGWLFDRDWAMPAIIITSVWKDLGFVAVLFLAGLQAIPNELYEAASVDGAGRWQKFRYVTFPQLRPTLLFSAVIASIGLMQFFEEPFVMTEGGPLDSTLSVAFHAYNQFSFGNYGYTAAISYVLFVVIAALTFVQFKLLRPNTE